MPGKKFKTGDCVAWCSQAGGYSKIKIGEIIEVVPAGKMPTKHRKMDSVTPRTHESYVVRVGRIRTYWPLVKYLS